MVGPSTPDPSFERVASGALRVPTARAQPIGNAHMPVDLVTVQGLWPVLSRVPAAIALFGR